VKILHINNVANVGSTLVEGLNKLGHQAELRSMKLVAGQRSTIVKLMLSPLRLQEILAINRQVAGGNYDIVHIHFAYLGWLGILGRYSYFLHCHGSDVRRDLKDPLRQKPILKSIEKAWKVFFSTPDLATIVQPIRSDAIFLSNPVNTDRFTPIQTPQNKPFRILIISWLSEIKNVRVAFEAIKKIKIKHPEIQITAIDHGPQREIYHSIPGVDFIPPVPYELMPALVQSHDVLLGQFKLGILSMAELESMACGIPVICYFNFPGWYPQPPPVLSAIDADQIATHIMSLVENPALYKENSQSGREWVVQNHGYLSVAKKLEYHYHASSGFK
jgi:glycosyltransferase involved in cell wall biosynthesis